MILLKTLFKKTPLYSLLIFWRKKNAIKKENEYQKQIIKEWESKGKPLPPPQCFKRLVIKKYTKQNSISVFIETGTYIGETLEYFKGYFKRLISIELDDTLYENAKKKFSNDKNIELYKGDSGEVIEIVINHISEACLFWLDGHYSEGITAKGKLNTPILAELNHILNHTIKDHVILIDDARCFTGEDDYPSIDYLSDFIKQKNPSLKFEVLDDIIRIHK